MKDLTRAALFALFATLVWIVGVVLTFGIPVALLTWGIFSLVSTGASLWNIASLVLGSVLLLIWVVRYSRS